MFRKDSLKKERIMGWLLDESFQVSRVADPGKHYNLKVLFPTGHQVHVVRDAATPFKLRLACAFNADPALKDAIAKKPERDADARHRINDLMLANPYQWVWDGGRLMLSDEVYADGLNRDLFMRRLKGLYLVTRMLWEKYRETALAVV